MKTLTAIILAVLIAVSMTACTQKRSPDQQAGLTEAFTEAPSAAPTAKPAASPTAMLTIEPTAEPPVILSYNEHDISKILAFLNTVDENGVSNGEKILEKYDPEDPASWYYYADDREREAGYARYITQWNADGRLIKLTLPFPFVSLTGSLDLSGCEALDYVGLNTSGITSADLSGCPLRERFSASDASLTEITPSSITTPALFISDCSVKHIEWNALPSSDEWGADRSFVLCLDSEGEGAVGVSCGEGENSRELVIYAYPAEGRSFVGWFDEDGKLYSADRACELPLFEERAAFTARFE